MHQQADEILVRRRPASTLHQPGHLDSNRYTSKVHAIHQHRRGRTASKLLIGVLICTVGAVFVLLAFHCMYWKESPNNSHEQHPDQHHDHDGQIQNFRIDQQHFPRPIPSQANSALKQESEFPTADAFDANTKQTLTLLPHLLSVINNDVSAIQRPNLLIGVLSARGKSTMILLS